MPLRCLMFGGRQGQCSLYCCGRRAQTAYEDVTAERVDKTDQAEEAEDAENDSRTRKTKPKTKAGTTLVILFTLFDC